MGDDLWTVGFHAVLGVLESSQPVDVLWIQKDRRDRRMQRIRTAARGRSVRYDVADLQAFIDGEKGDRAGTWQKKREESEEGTSLSEK